MSRLQKELTRPRLKPVEDLENNLIPKWGSFLSNHLINRALPVGKLSPQERWTLLKLLREQRQSE